MRYVLSDSSDAINSARCDSSQSALCTNIQFVLSTDQGEKRNPWGVMDGCGGVRGGLVETRHSPQIFFFFLHF